ncbi:CCA tRNA nucleotidyltransferase [Novosphingobium huizhouense]|uniref:CCA tRNA nucleotidyltransferase n=1 Tax=Novosphingobium huizhouense TaxID=2866625 RepID=UPI001CD8D4E7|nr:CCA tRNA nucleotidyltransferase [Novosphingobium huizhouense]
MAEPVLLPPSDWFGRTDLAALVAALGPGNARYVGGVVRDTLLGFAPKDVDMASVLLPQATLERLAAAGIRAVPTGLAHGTVTAVLEGGPVEITTLRRDVETDGRHATVAFSTEWREDAARRDFTINALYVDPASGEVFDWFGGLDDLNARRVRFIGDAETRIREDYLRILRYFRFQARFGSLPADAQAEAAVLALGAGLKGLSRERIAGELLALLALPAPSATLARMAELGVLTHVLPEADPAPLGALEAAEAREGVAPDPLRRLAAILPADPAAVDQIGARLRLSTAQRKRLAAAARRSGSETEAEARALAYRLGIDEARDRMLLAGRTLAPIAGWEAPRFPLKGGDVVARGVGAGPQVAATLRKVEDGWVASGFDDAAIPALLEAALSA